MVRQLFGDRFGKGIRVNQLAKELSVESKSILQQARDEGLGDKAPNHMSVLKLGLAETVRRMVQRGLTAAAPPSKPLPPCGRAHQAQAPRKSRKKALTTTRSRAADIEPRTALRPPKHLQPRQRSRLPPAPDDRVAAPVVEAPAPPPCRSRLHRRRRSPAPAAPHEVVVEAPSRATPERRCRAAAVGQQAGRIRPCPRARSRRFRAPTITLSSRGECDRPLSSAQARRPRPAS